MISPEAVKYSLRNLKQRKGRSAFTILSILIGIATIFIFISFGLGLFLYMQDITTGSSTDKIIIQPKGGALSPIDTNVKLTNDDLEAIDKVAGVYKVSGSYYKTVEVKDQNKIVFSFMISYDPDVPIIFDSFNIGLDKGKFLTNGKKSILAGYNYQIPERIFPQPMNLNQRLEINGNDIKIAGFVEEVGNPQDDSQIYISNDYMEELYPDEELSYGMIVAQVDLENIDTIVERVERELRKERGLEKGKEDFFVGTFSDLVEGYSNALNIVIGFIILIALISVVVSAINTANTMITSVLERTKEIGIIKSIGARNVTVFSIFLFESGFIGFIAGIIGVVLGYVFTEIANTILSNIGYGFLQANYHPWLFIGLILFATFTGAISGVFPAIRASKINPVKALRYE